jgi:hypothetical protein
LKTRWPVVLVATLAVVVLMPESASAAPGWSITPTYSPIGPAAGVLTGISCPSANDCWAVGSYNQNSAGRYASGRTLVEHWNGTTWKPVAAPSPAQSPYGYSAVLAQVTCASSSLCFAVGSINFGAPLIEQWNGSTWMQVTDITAPSNTTLRGVDCVSATYCVAVGSGSGGTVILDWHGGTSWSTVTHPHPSSYTINLFAVSCSSVSRCTAVGWREPAYNGPLAPYIVQWDGSAWSVVDSPYTGRRGAFWAVDCPSDNACYAVGDAQGGTGSDMIIARWDGTSWSDESLTDVVTTLNGISCPTETKCVAVGTTGTKNTTVYRNGSTWSVKPAPTPADAYEPGLVAVACTSATHCTSVGFASSIYCSPAQEFDCRYQVLQLTYVLRWNGNTWSYVQPATPGTQARIDGMSCTTTTNCMAVGSYYSNDGPVPMGVVVSGGSSALKPAPRPSGAGTAVFKGVSCTSTTNCIAVGSYDTGPSTSHKTLVERWNGTSWSIMSSPSGTNQHAYLRSVSCVNATNCTAVGDAGYYAEPYTNEPLILHFDGASWSNVTPPTSYGTLAAVSCPAVNFCDAVGTSAAHWDGSTWTVDAIVTHDGSYSGVSCTSATSCLAVGSYYPDSGTEGPTPMSSVWDGNTWAEMPTPVADPREKSTELLAVSCSSSTSCNAVGRWYNAISSRTLVEHWDGSTWTVVDSPNRFGANRNQLMAVSCAADDNCYAGGASTVPPFNVMLLENFG